MTKQHPLIGSDPKRFNGEKLHSCGIDVQHCSPHQIKGDVRGIDLDFAVIGTYKGLYLYVGKTWDRYHWETLQDPAQVALLQVVKSGAPVEEYIDALEKARFALEDIVKSCQWIFNLSDVFMILWHESATEGGLDLPPLSAKGRVGMPGHRNGELPIQESRPDLADLYAEDAMAIVEMDSFFGKKLTRDPEGYFKSPQFLTRSGRVVVLDIPRCGLKEFPLAMGKLTALELIDADDNSVLVVPEWINKLTNLQKLYLRGNRIHTLPPSIGSLSNLKILDLSQNAISSLPNEIHSLPCLEILVLSSNKLGALPEFLCQISPLIVLSAEKLQLTSLPDNIGNLDHLQALCLSENHLETLPRSIGNLRALILLNVS